MLKSISPRAALDKLQALCDRSEISTGEARTKLQRWGVPPQAAEQIIAALVKARYIDDARFAGAYTREKARYALWGPRKIALSLRQKGVDSETIATALDEISAEEQQEAIEHLLRVKTSNHPELLSDYAGRAKLFRFGISRGFDTAMVSSAIKALASE